MRWLLALLLCAPLFAQVAGSTGERGIAPTVSLPSITTTSPLPTGTQNSAYNNVTMTVSGGTAPFTWSVTAGALPTGLSLSSAGVISGTPSVAQTTTPTIQVSDNNARTASTVFSITINAAGAGGGTDCITNLGYASNATISVSDTSQVPPSGSKLNVAGRAYCLNADITNTDSAVSIQADNISLDLNGHTITYATTDAGAQPRFGIVGIGSAEADAAGNPSGGNFTNPTIYSSQACTLDGNGKPTVCSAQIIQGAGAVGINDAVRFGGAANGSSCGGGTFHDFSTTVSHPTSSQSGKKASASIHFRNCEGALHIYQVLTNNSEAWVVNRTNLEGPDIRLENWSSSAGAALEIDHNNFSGGGQGGVLPYEHWGALIHHNTIGTSGHAIQDFAVFGYGTNDVINNNTINCASCRGIFLSGHNFHPATGTGVSVHDNTVTFSMLAQYCNDGACPSSANWSCETHGSYGVQFDDQILSSTVYSNTFTGTVQNSTDGAGNTTSCQVAGERVSGVGDALSTSHDNTFNIKRGTAGVTAKAIGFYTEAAANPAFTSTDDTFNADSANFFADWQGAQANQTFIRPIIGQPSGGNPDSGYVTFYFFNGQGSNCSTPSVCPIHWFFTDPTFNNSATRDSNNMGAYNTASGSKGPAEYFIQWTYKPTINCAIGSGSCTPGNPISGATVTINDVTPTQVFSNTTDANGHLVSGAGTVLIEFRRSNCPTANFGNSCGSNGSVTKYFNTPHSVTISKAACTTISGHSVDLTGVTLASAVLTETINLTCP